MSRLYDIFLRRRGVATDSRAVGPGSLFFALRGDRFDGNRFAVQALRNGASVAVCDDPEAVRGQSGAGEYIADGRIVFVPDALRALQELAAEYRRSWSFPVLAITGTNGKTTTKELVTRVLSCKYRVHSTRGNLNNHIGVPLTILAAPADTDFAVIEMGAGARGEIELLCNVAQPDYGLITNVGYAHLEGFGGIEGVMAGKGELYDFLTANGGTAFHLIGDGRLDAMIDARPGLKEVGYAVSLADGIEHNLTGEYNRPNVAAAVAVGDYFRIPLRQAAAAIAAYVPDNNRSQRILTAHNTVIADCYNANPSSMAAAIASFGAEPAGEMTKLVILGDMKELGEHSPAAHSQVVETLRASGIGQAWLVGPNFAEALRNCGNCGCGDRPGPVFRLFSDTAELSSHLSAEPPADCLLLVKGSHSMGLEKILPLL